MIYVLDDTPPLIFGPRFWWTMYVSQCIQWRIGMLKSMFPDRPSLAQQETRIHYLEMDINLRGYIRPNDDTDKEHWTDALALWKRQPQKAKDVVVASIGAKFSTVPGALGLVDTPRRYVYLPKTACVLANAVADVARDSDIIWQFRKEFLGQDAPQTTEAFSWRVAAHSLAALLNRPEHLLRETWRMESWYATRICEKPDIPDLELIPSS
jgi:hypothetical protein